jgi:hypothetical protein
MTYTCSEKEVDYLQADARDGKDASERAGPAIFFANKVADSVTAVIRRWFNSKPSGPVMYFLAVAFPP